MANGPESSTLTNQYILPGPVKRQLWMSLQNARLRSMQICVFFFLCVMPIYFKLSAYAVTVRANYVKLQRV